MASERQDPTPAADRRTAKTSRKLPIEHRRGGAPAGEQLSDMELALTVLWNAVRRWITQSGQGGEPKGLSELDVFIVHLLVFRNRPLRVIDLAFALSIDDVHQVTYSLKKLTRLGMIAGAKSGKEMFYTASESGRRHYEAFIADRTKYLEPSMRLFADGEHDLVTLTAFLRTLSGVYEQAARAAASMKG